MAGTYFGAGAAGRLETSVGPMAHSSVGTSEKSTCTFSRGGPAISETASTMARPRNSFITVVRPRNISTLTIGIGSSPLCVTGQRPSGPRTSARGPDLLGYLGGGAPGAGEGGGHHSG